ncbi:MAG: hypothetical protein JRM74_02580 [Nitrososphaerota archaeon]|nr:hypothetical protein [Nitrososphaerota archaeon]
MVTLAGTSDWLLIIVMIMGLMVEDRYISRPAIVTNTISIFIVTTQHWNSAGWVLQGYAVLGLFFGLIAFLSYLTQKSLDSDFYRLTFFLYHTFTATLYVFIAGLL